MRKQRKSKKSGAKRQFSPTQSQVAGTQARSRRDVLQKAATWSLGLAAAGGAAYYFVDSTRATMREHDLSLVGNGTPSVVQVHDPQCPSCRALQKETRAALQQFGDGELNYVIADIKTNKGQRFANTHGVPHVTLLLFDGKGELRNVLQGRRPRAQLRVAFQRLVSG